MKFLFRIINIKLDCLMLCAGSCDQKERKKQISAKKIQNYIFNLDDLLGKGSFGVAYKGFDINSGKEVAIKVIKMSQIKSKTSLKLLFNQIDILKTLESHPNILKCFDIFTSVNNNYIITQLCQKDLQKQLSRKEKFKEFEIKQLVYGIYQGLEHLAKNNIVHRDIKISNILLSKNGEPKIADFGFAVKANTNFKDINIGSPLYMSPEGLLYKQYGPKTDVWSFGVLIYQLLHGVTPLQQCHTEEQLKAQILKPAVFQSPISIQLKQVILKCLTVDQAKRPSISQLGCHSYFRGISNESHERKHLLFLKQISKISTEQSLRFEPQSNTNYFYKETLSYENALSILHYCRLLHKVNVKFADSKILSQFLINLSSKLCQAEFLLKNTSNEQLKKLKEVLKEYQRKFKVLKVNYIGIDQINPIDLLAEIERLINKKGSKTSMQAFSILDIQTKIFLYSLSHENPDILTKNSQARILIEKGKI